jgi:cytoskeleton protein RodZ
MTESGAVPAHPGTPFPASGSATSAGQLLRRAREAQGLQIDALAASIKVTARKLELLEADRFDELPDATFTRALAQTVCRSLKLDAAPVLALLPSATGHRIEQVSEGLNAPFRDRSARLDGLAWGPLLKAAWAPALFLSLAALIFFLPAGSRQIGMDAVRGIWQSIAGSSREAPASAEPVASPPAPQAAADVAPAQPVVETVFAAPPAEASASAPASAAPEAGPLQLRASAESWIEVKDGQDRILLSRSVQPGETLTLDGAMPLRLKIGNAVVTEVRFRGEPIDLGPMTRENIARLELQ